MYRNSMRRQRRGQSLVGILISVFLMIGLAVFFLMPRGGDNTKPGKTVLKQSMERAQDVGTNSYLSQIQQGISQFKGDNDGKPPASLEELKKYLKDYPPEMWVNQVDQKPFLYDPASGTICAQGPGCPPTAPATSTVAPGGNPPPPGGNPPPPGAAAPAPAPADPTSPTGPGGIHMRIPAPGAGAADAMRDN